MQRKGKLNIPIVKVRKGATRREKYAAVHKSFTADDLQKFTETERGIAVDIVLAEMKTMLRKSGNGKKKTK